MNIKLTFIFSAFCLTIMGFAGVPANAETWAMCETEKGLCLYTSPGLEIGDNCSCFGDPGKVPPIPPALSSNLGDSCLVGNNLCEIREPQALGTVCQCLDKSGKVIQGPAPSEIINSRDK